MEGAYNKVYRARERVPREEYAFLLERLMGTVRYVCAFLFASVAAKRLSGCGLNVYGSPKGLTSALDGKPVQGLSAA